MNPTPLFDSREHKANQILAENGVKIVNRARRLFSVQSQSGHDPYLVNLQNNTCQCFDAVSRVENCKHQRAARKFEARDKAQRELPDIPKPIQSHTYAELFVVLRLTK